jgi:hypothetical protein
MLERKHHGTPWPSREVTPTVAGLLDAMIARLNRTSALWQQFGFLHDLIVMPEQGGPARHYEEMPLAYVQETELSASSHYYTMTMELPLHPVIRRWNGPLLVAEHHLLEDLHGEWKREDLHFAPLREFLQEQLRERVRVLTGWS